MTRINTPQGSKRVLRRVGVAGEYYLTSPTETSPNGEWWTLNPQTGYVSVPWNSRALCSALEVSV